MLYRNFNQNYDRLNKIGEGSYGKVYLGSNKYTINKEVNITNQNSHPNKSQNNNQDNSNKKQNSLILKQTNSNKRQYYAFKKLKRLSKGPYTYNYNNENEQGQKKNSHSGVQELKQIQIMKILQNHHKQCSNNQSQSHTLHFKQITSQIKQYETCHYLILPFGVQLLEFAKHKQLNLSKLLLKNIIYQIIQGVKEIHDLNIIHRDLKPDNIFLMKNGIVKIGDFSLSKVLYKNIKKQIPQEQAQQIQNCKLTGNVTTRYYRAPQIIYGSRDYNQNIDIWSLGCTLAQLILYQPIFPGQTDINQLQLIFSTIGYPQQKWQKASQLPFYLQFIKDKQQKGLKNLLFDIQPQLLDLIQKCLQLDPQKRPNINKLIKHKYFNQGKEELVQNFKLKQIKEQLQKVAIYLHEKKINQFLTKKN